MSKTTTNPSHGTEEKHIGIGLMVGVTAGAVIGSITGEIPFWVSMGCCAGLLLGILVPRLQDGLASATRSSGPDKSSR